MRFVSVTLLKWVFPVLSDLMIFFSFGLIFCSVNQIKPTIKRTFSHTRCSLVWVDGGKLSEVMHVVDSPRVTLRKPSLYFYIRLWSLYIWMSTTMKFLMGLFPLVKFKFDFLLTLRLPENTGRLTFAECRLYFSRVLCLVLGNGLLGVFISLQEIAAVPFSKSVRLDSLCFQANCIHMAVFV